MWSADEKKNNQKEVAVSLKTQFSPGISDDEAAEHRSDSSSRPSYSHGGSSSSDEFSGCVNVSAHSAGLESSHRHLLLGGCDTQGCQQWSSLKHKDKPDWKPDWTCYFQGFRGLGLKIKQSDKEVRGE